MEIKAVTINDLHQLVELSRLTFVTAFASQNTAADMEMHVATHLTEAALKPQLLHPCSQFWWILHQKQPIAYCKLNVAGAQSDINDAESLEIERLYILPQWQNKGLGLQLMQHAMDTAIGLHLQFIWLGVWEKNTRAIAFYERHGFTKFGTHAFLLGTDLQTDWLMKKPLAQP